MSFSPKPCAHCDSTSFAILPNQQVELWEGTTVFGVAASRKRGALRWSFTLVVCSSCGRSETFTTNAAEIASQTAGSHTIQTTRR